MLDMSTRVTSPGPPTEIVPVAPAGHRSDPAALLDAVLIVLRMIETEALNRPLTPDLTGPLPTIPTESRP